MVNKMLHINQDERITAREALAHPWFSKDLSAMNEIRPQERNEEQKREFIQNQYEFEI